MSAKLPLYYSIMLSIKELILDGTYPIGSLLPTETDFENQFNVSKITVRKAVELLENEGYVSKKSGKGTTVISNSLINRLSKGESFSSILNKSGYQLKKEDMKSTFISLVPQNELYSIFGDHCLKIERTYYLDGKPYIFMTHYLPGDLTLDEKIDAKDFSIYHFLHQHKYNPQSFDDDFFVDYPPKHVLNILNTTDQALLCRKRTTCDLEHRIIEVSYSIYNTKIHHYQISLQV
ncbi:MAG: GntR family transcriptional regulator [Beduini sp.]|uniref:GntR family transcriptional regulator n=1 Tax=Beduini sp. TaxID=1922300 RepID=UPI0039A397E0